MKCIYGTVNPFLEALNWVCSSIHSIIISLLMPLESAIMGQLC